MNKEVQQSISQKTAKKLLDCRDIVRTVKDFGIDDFMIMQIINLLALELESRDAMLALHEVVRQHAPEPEQEKKLFF